MACSGAVTVPQRKQLTVDEFEAPPLPANTVEPVRVASSWIAHFAPGAAIENGVVHPPAVGSLSTARQALSGLGAPSTFPRSNQRPRLRRVRRAVVREKADLRLSDGGESCPLRRRSGARIDLMARMTHRGETGSLRYC